MQFVVQFVVHVVACQIITDTGFHLHVSHIKTMLDTIFVIAEFRYALNVTFVCMHAFIHIYLYVLKYAYIYVLRTYVHTHSH